MATVRCECGEFLTFQSESSAGRLEKCAKCQRNIFVASADDADSSGTSEDIERGRNGNQQTPGDVASSQSASAHEATNEPEGTYQIAAPNDLPDRGATGDEGWFPGKVLNCPRCGSTDDWNGTTCTKCDNPDRMEPDTYMFSELYDRIQFLFPFMSQMFAMLAHRNGLIVEKGTWNLGGGIISLESRLSGEGRSLLYVVEVDIEGFVEFSESQFIHLERADAVELDYETEIEPSTPVTIRISEWNAGSLLGATLTGQQSSERERTFAFANFHSGNRKWQNWIAETLARFAGERTSTEKVVDPQQKERKRKKRQERAALVKEREREVRETVRDHNKQLLGQIRDYIPLAVAASGFLGLCCSCILIPMMWPEADGVGEKAKLIILGLICPVIPWLAVSVGVMAMCWFTLRKYEFNELGEMEANRRQQSAKRDLRSE